MVIMCQYALSTCSSTSSVNFKFTILHTHTQTSTSHAMNQLVSCLIRPVDSSFTIIMKLKVNPSTTTQNPNRNNNGCPFLIYSMQALLSVKLFIKNEHQFIAVFEIRHHLQRSHKKRKVEQIDNREITQSSDSKYTDTLRSM